VNQIHGELIDLTKSSPSPSKKRKLSQYHNHQQEPILNRQYVAQEKETKVANKANLLAHITYNVANKSIKKDHLSEPEEKRLRLFRKKAPQTYLERLHRVRTQRMFLIDRQRNLSESRSHEEEIFDIAGTTGNLYQVTISKQPSCTCPDCKKGNQCKHIIIGNASRSGLQQAKAQE
jgi:hypothetical protein